MNNYLSSLPFHENEAQLSDCQCPTQGFDPPSFKLYSESDRLPTFALRLPPLGEEPDLAYAKECIRIKTCDGDTVASVTMEQAGVKLLKDTNSYYLVYNGSRIPDIKLECGSCYRLKIAGYFSEVFYITNTPQEKLRLEFSNKFQLGDVPYQAEYTQKLLIDGEICSLDADLFESRKGENNGKETISYQRLTYRKGMTIHSAPDYIAQLIGAAGIHDNFSVFHKGEEIKTLKKRVKADLVQNGCCDYDLEVALPIRDIEIIGGNCQTDVDTTLTEVEIPDGLPDSCTVDEDWTATDEVLCLKFGEVPPPIAPPITPVGTPPVVPACPPSGFELGSESFTTDCTNPWIKEGVRYKRKVTKTIANGTCGSTTSDLFYDVCIDDPGDNGSVVISNVSCGGIDTPTETTVKPPWLNRLSITLNKDSHESTLYLHATSGTSMRLAATSGAQPYGISTGGLVWDSNTWLPGTSQDTGTDYSELFRANPASYATGGLEAGREYAIYIRRDSDPYTVFKKVFTTPSDSVIYPPLDIQLATGGINPCGRFPTIGDIEAATQEYVRFKFDGADVNSMKCRARKKSDGVLMRSKIISPTNNTVVFPYETLEPGIYTLEIEGDSCSSDVSYKDFTVTAGGVIPFAFTSGYPFLASTSLYLAITKTGPYSTIVKNRTTGQFFYNSNYAYTANEPLVIQNLTEGDYDIDIDSLHATVHYAPPVVDPNNIVPKVMTDSLKSDLDLDWSGSSENWTVTDLSTYAAPANHRFRYRAGGTIIDGAQLVNFVWQSNEPCRIVKCTCRNDFPDTGPWGGGQADQGDPTVSAGMTNGSSSYAYSTTMFQPQ